MKNFNKTGIKIGKIALLLLIILLGMFSKSYAAVDTTLFLIKSLQDTVDAGDTVDVDLFIGDADHLADSIKEFEIEIEYDLDICDKNHIDFQLDSTSLAAFFSTSAFTDVTTISNTTGHVNIKVSCNTIGRGTTRIGRIKYIIETNANGRQLLKFDFFKISAKRLSGGGGNSKPVKMLTDSVLMIKGFRTQVPTAIRNNTMSRVKIFPNPVTDILRVEGLGIQQYQLFSMKGDLVSSGNGNPSESILINSSEFNAGKYILILKTEKEWQSYPVLKE